MREKNPFPGEMKILAYYALNLKEFFMERHTHDRYEIMYAVEGQCEVEVENERYRLMPKDFIFIDRRVPHRLLVEKGIPCVLLNLEFADGPGGSVNLEKLCGEEPSLLAFWKTPPAFQVFHDSEKVCFAMKDLIEELERIPSSVCLLRLLFSRLLIEIVRCSGRDALFQTGAGYASEARTYILQNFDQPLTTEQIAAHMGLNRSYLQTLFKKHYGTGMIAYAIQLRLDKACFLLKNTSKSITDIAFEAGFNSRQEFGRCFFQKFSQSPREYRKITARQPEVDTGEMKKIGSDHPVR